jgi:hypothetical protein
MINRNREAGPDPGMKYQQAILGLQLVCLVAIFGWLLVVYPIMERRVGQMEEFIATQKNR